MHDYITSVKCTLLRLNVRTNLIYFHHKIFDLNGLAYMKYRGGLCFNPINTIDKWVHSTICFCLSVILHYTCDHITCG